MKRMQKTIMLVGGIVGFSASTTVAQGTRINNDVIAVKEQLTQYPSSTHPAPARTLLTKVVVADKVAAPAREEVKGALAVGGLQLEQQRFTQGSLIFGTTVPGARLRLDDMDVDVDVAGSFVFGFDRDHGPRSTLELTYPDGKVMTHDLHVEARDFVTVRLTVDQSKVSGFTRDQRRRIEESRAKKKAARQNPSMMPHWRSGFQWPATGRISGHYGTQRIYNDNDAKRPHSGTDIAASTGTPVKAPADGIITLAETDMYFEGGLILIDHGQGVESALMHLSRIDTRVGTKVQKGDIIGAVGATGRVTGPHLHWSLKWKSRLVDAALLLPQTTVDGTPWTRME